MDCGLRFCLKSPFPPHATWLAVNFMVLPFMFRSSSTTREESSFGFLISFIVNEFSQHHLLNNPSFTHWLWWLLYLHEVPVFSETISSSLFLFFFGPLVCPCQYHTVFVTMALMCALISARTSVPSLLCQRWNYLWTFVFLFQF